MKRLYLFIYDEIKLFIINPFWVNWPLLAILILALSCNGLVWFQWWKRYQDLVGVMPISYAFAVLVLNIFLANISYRKESLVSFILVAAALLVQIIYIIFIKFFAMSQAF